MAPIFVWFFSITYRQKAGGSDSTSNRGNGKKHFKVLNKIIQSFQKSSFSSQKNIHNKQWKALIAKYLLFKAKIIILQEVQKTMDL